ncbi:hypothetical protein RJT34_15238 [Clitoria ternatea]|uniref:Uncharacterized protein n=1 Tax=Clitoria ternatea TaxID=43366 RepID=A0AAN9JUA1_CLITE
MVINVVASLLFVRSPPTLVLLRHDPPTASPPLEQFLPFWASTFFLHVPLLEILASHHKIDPEAELSFKELVSILTYECLNTCSKGSVDKFVMLYLWQGISQVEFYTWICFSILYSVCKKSRGESTMFQAQGCLKGFMVEDGVPLLPKGRD